MNVCPEAKIGEKDTKYSKRVTNFGLPGWNKTHRTPEANKKTVKVRYRAIVKRKRSTRSKRRKGNLRVNGFFGHRIERLKVFN